MSAATKPKAAGPNQARAKALYCQGRPVTEIATTLGVSRATIYAWKHKDRAQGVDWGTLRFVKATDSADARRQEQDFVALLIYHFETALDQMNALQPGEQLKELTRYASTYYKLKLQRDNPSVNKADIAKQVLHELSRLALAHEASAVVRFLADHADTIVSAVILD